MKEEGRKGRLPLPLHSTSQTGEEEEEAKWEGERVAPLTRAGLLLLLLLLPSESDL